jgi:hypothetical protein
MKLSKEPIVWIGFVIAVLMVVADYLNGDLGMQSLDALLVAAGALIGRSLVVPWTKFKDVQGMNHKLARELARLETIKFKDDEGV